MIRTGLIGLGHWGKIWAQKLSKSKVFELKQVYSSHISAGFGDQVQYLDSTDALLTSNEIDFVFILSPASTHLRLAQAAMSHGKSVFITKPVGLNANEVCEMEDLAMKLGKRVYVDHTFLYSPGFEALKQRLSAKGPITHIQSYRLQWGRLQQQSNVLLELIYHDIYMCLELAKNSPVKNISCRGLKSLEAGQIDTAVLNMEFENGIKAQLSASQSHIGNFRRFLVHGEKFALEWDLGDGLQEGFFAKGNLANLGKTALPVDGSQGDAIDRMLKEIAKDLQGEPGRISKLSDAIKVQNLIDRASVGL